MRSEDIEVYEKAEAQLVAFANEMKELSKKKPDAPLNRFKLDFINSILASLNEYLKEKHRPFKEFEKFDPDEMPSNSDVVLILAQYMTCMVRFREENTGYHTGYWYWKIEGKLSAERTISPEHVHHVR